MSEIRVHDNYPAINVKHYGWNVDNSDIAEKYGLLEAVATEVNQSAYEIIQGTFWNSSVPRLIEQFLAIPFGQRKIEHYAGGKSGGWLEVDLEDKDPDEWNKSQLHAWENF